MKAITIHGRTRMQFYNGKADWDAIRAVREVVSRSADCQWRCGFGCRCARDSAPVGCGRRSWSGRSCQGRPCMPAFSPALRLTRMRRGVACIFAEHYEMMLEFYGVEVGLRTARKTRGLVSRSFRARASRFGEGRDSDIDRYVFRSDSVVAAIARSGDAAAREEIAA